MALRIEPMLVEGGATRVAPLVVAVDAAEARRPGSAGLAHVPTELGIRHHGDVVTSGQLAQEAREPLPVVVLLDLPAVAPDVDDAAARPTSRL
jgi:hypothetical protein